MVRSGLASDASYFFRDDWRRGTFAPFSRASLRPIAIACLRLFTLRPEPLFRVPFFLRCIADLTRLLAALPYLAMHATDAKAVLRSPPVRAIGGAELVARRAGHGAGFLSFLLLRHRGSGTASHELREPVVRLCARPRGVGYGRDMTGRVRGIGLLIAVLIAGARGASGQSLAYFPADGASSVNP